MITKAADVLQAAMGHMQDRAATYDKPEGERSMPATVAAFNAVTGLGLTAEEGWLFCVLLKAVRSQQGAYRADNYEDGAAYFALMGEQAACDRAGAVSPTEFGAVADWIKHDGSDICPVPRGTLIDVRYSDGDEVFGIRALQRNETLTKGGAMCGAEYWGPNGKSWITHYRLA